MDSLNDESFIVLMSTMNTLVLWFACEAFLSYMVPMCVNTECPQCGTSCDAMEEIDATPNGIFEENSVILGCGVGNDGNWNCACESYPCFIPLPPLKDPPPSPKIVRALRNSPPSPGESYWGRLRAESYEELDEQYGQNDTPFFASLGAPYTYIPPLPPSPDEVRA